MIDYVVRSNAQGGSNSHCSLIYSTQTIYEAPLRVVRVPVCYFHPNVPSHNILPHVLANIGKYVVSWLKPSRKRNSPLPGPIESVLCRGSNIRVKVIGRYPDQSKVCCVVAKTFA